MSGGGASFSAVNIRVPQLLASVGGLGVSFTHRPGINPNRARRNLGEIYYDESTEKDVLVETRNQ